MLNPYESPRSEQPKKPIHQLEWYQQRLYSTGNILVVSSLLFKIALQVLNFPIDNFKQGIFISNTMLGVGLLLIGLSIYFKFRKNAKP
jgi:hypothetical protein